MPSSRKKEIVYIREGDVLRGTDADQAKEKANVEMRVKRFKAALERIANQRSGAKDINSDNKSHNNISNNGGKSTGSDNNNNGNNSKTDNSHNKNHDNGHKSSNTYSTSDINTTNSNSCDGNKSNDDTNNSSNSTSGGNNNNNDDNSNNNDDSNSTCGSRSDINSNNSVSNKGHDNIGNNGSNSTSDNYNNGNNSNNYNHNKNDDNSNICSSSYDINTNNSTGNYTNRNSSDSNKSDNYTNSSSRYHISNNRGGNNDKRNVIMNQDNIRKDCNYTQLSLPLTVHTSGQHGLENGRRGVNEAKNYASNDNTSDAAGRHAPSFSSSSAVHTTEQHGFGIGRSNGHGAQSRTNRGDGQHTRNSSRSLLIPQVGEQLGFGLESSDRDRNRDGKRSQSLQTSFTRDDQKESGGDLQGHTTSHRGQRAQAIKYSVDTSPHQPGDPKIPKFVVNSLKTTESPIEGTSQYTRVSYNHNPIQDQKNKRPSPRIASTSSNLQSSNIMSLPDSNALLESGPRTSSSKRKKISSQFISTAWKNSDSRSASGSASSGQNVPGSSFSLAAHASGQHGLENGQGGGNEAQNHTNNDNTSGAAGQHTPGFSSSLAIHATEQRGFRSRSDGYGAPSRTNSGNGQHGPGFSSSPSLAIHPTEQHGFGSRSSGYGALSHTNHGDSQHTRNISRSFLIPQVGEQLGFGFESSDRDRNRSYKAGCNAHDTANGKQSQPRPTSLARDDQREIGGDLQGHVTSYRGQRAQAKSHPASQAAKCSIHTSLHQPGDPTLTVNSLKTTESPIEGTSQYTRASYNQEQKNQKRPSPLIASTSSNLQSSNIMSLPDSSALLESDPRTSTSKRKISNQFISTASVFAGGDKDNDKKKRLVSNTELSDNSTREQTLLQSQVYDMFYEHPSLHSAFSSLNASTGTSDDTSDSRLDGDALLEWYIDKAVASFSGASVQKTAAASDNAKIRDKEQEDKTPCKGHAPNVRCMKCLFGSKGKKVARINGTNVFGFK